MMKTKVLYIVIILGLVVFIVRNISLFLPKQHFTFMGSINLAGNKVVVDNPDVEKFISETAIEKNDIDNNFRKHVHSDVLKIVNEEKTIETNSGGAVVAPPSKFDSKSLDTNKGGEKSSENLHKETIKLKEDKVQSSNLRKKVPEKVLSVPSLKPCPARGSNLVGPLYIEQKLPNENDIKALSIEYGGSVEKGGWWAPNTCSPRTKVAVIIPFRKREEQLKIFLNHIHPILQRQQLFYRIIVVEQLEDDPFNRAGLFNIGFVESLKISPFDCFVFSDVDLLPEDDRNYYGCPTSPRHMSVAVDKFNYRLPYATIFGGVGAFTKKHFEEINGMSNLFWGWGGEDDDLYKRISSLGLSLTRPSMILGRYTMIKRHHFQSSKADPNRMNLLRNSAERMVVDGLNTLKYHLKEVLEDPLVTYVKIQMKKEDYLM